MSNFIRPVHYQFGCDAQGEIEVSNSGFLMTNLVSEGHPSCLFPSNTMSSNSLVESKASIENLKEWSSNATSLAVELWMIPGPDDDATTKPIFTIGRPSRIEENLDISSETAEEEWLFNGAKIMDECSGLHFSLGQRGPFLELRFVDQNDAESCRILVVRQKALQPGVLQQVIVTMTNGETNIFMDGLPILMGAPNQFDPSLTTWDSNAIIHLFASTSSALSTSDDDLTNAQHDDDFFEGSLGMVSIYSTELTDADASALYERGLAELTSAWEDRDPLPLTLLPKIRHPAILRQGQRSRFTLQVVAGNPQFTQMMSHDSSIQVEIKSLPKYGYLAVNETERVITDIGQRVMLSQEDLINGLSLLYQPHSDDFFNFPQHSHSGEELGKSSFESFDFRVIAVHGRDDPLRQQGNMTNDEIRAKLLGYSEIVVQELIVTHVNHRPSLHLPKSLTVPKKQASDSGSRPRAFLENAQVNDADYNIDRIRVDVWANNGTLTIPDTYRTLADFVSCRGNERQKLLGADASWNCHGTGVNNRNFTFVAEPDDVSEILSHLEYIGFRWNQSDEIVIRLFDGVGGPCLSQIEHQQEHNSALNESMQNSECFVVAASIDVPPISHTSASSSSKRGGYLAEFFDFDDFGGADWLFWGLVLMVLMACFTGVRASLRCIRLLGARDGKIHAKTLEEESASQEETRNEEDFV